MRSNAENNASQCSEMQRGLVQCTLMHGCARSVLSNTVRLHFGPCGRTGPTTIRDGRAAVNWGSVRCKQVQHNAGNGAKQCSVVRRSSAQFSVVHGGARTILPNTVRLNFVFGGAT